MDQWIPTNIVYADIERYRAYNTGLGVLYEGDCLELLRLIKHNCINFYKISAYVFRLKLIGFGRRLLLKCKTNLLNLDTNSFMPPIAEKP